jgi:hypothetical protein
MLRLIAILALAGALAGCGTSPFSQAPASHMAPAANTTPPGAAGTKYDCVTDEGNGRTQPCGQASF